LSPTFMPQHSCRNISSEYSGKPFARQLNL
jgi:hypothetical protein